MSSLAPTGGQALGAIAASVLAQYAPAPIRLIWWLLLGAFVASLLGVVTTQKPGTRRPQALGSLRPGVSVPRRPGVPSPPPCPAWLACGRSAASTCHWDRRSPPSCCTRNLLWGGILLFLLSGLGTAATGALAKMSPARVMLAGCLAVTAGPW